MTTTETTIEPRQPSLFEKKTNMSVKVQSRCRTAFAVAAAIASLSSHADYPERPIRYIVPSAPGGGADISARLLTTELAQQLKQQFVIDNRPSSGGLIGVQMLARSRPDGYTLGYGNMTYLAINSSLVPNLPYDAERDLTPIGQFTSGVNLLAVRNTLPVKSVQELITYARANPDKLSFASSGNGSTLHLSGELFKQMTGIRMTHVPYKGIAQGLTDLFSGQIDVVFDNQSSIAPHVAAARVRALAVTGPSRSFVFPELPTMIEAGVPGYVITTWTAMMGPAGLPRSIIEKLNAEIARACAASKVQAALATQGAVCATSSPSEFRTFVAKERVKWGDIVRKSGAKID